MALFVIKLEDRILYDATAVALIAQTIGAQAGEIGNTPLPDEPSALAVVPSDMQMESSSYATDEDTPFIHVTDRNGTGFLHMVSSALAVQTLMQSQKADAEQIRNEMPDIDVTKQIGDNFGQGMTNESLSFRLVDGEPQLPRQSREMNYSDALDALNYVQDQPEFDSPE